MFATNWANGSPAWTACDVRCTSTAAATTVITNIITTATAPNNTETIVTRRR
jgi:hypothetical protein